MSSNKRIKLVEDVFSNSCLNAIILSDDLEAVKYIVEHIPHKFDKFLLATSENHTVEIISYLYESPIKIDWKNVLYHICGTSNLKVVKYLYEQMKLRWNMYSRYDMELKFNAIRHRQANIYNYLYERHIDNYNREIREKTYTYAFGDYDPRLVSRLVLEEHVTENDIATFVWMQENGCRFCPNKLLGYACMLNKDNSREDLCQYLYSIYLNCPVHLNKCGYLHACIAGKWLYDQGLARDKYNEYGAPKEEYWISSIKN